MPQRRAIVIGGSLGGLLAANMLHSIGWHVDVFERAGDDLASRGAGIGTHEEVFTVLARIGITIDPTIGVLVPGRNCLDSTGKLIAYVPAPRIMSSWARLYRPLKDLFPAAQYHFGMSLEGIEQSAAVVTAIFSDGTRVTGDLLIGADGFRSTVRTLMMPEAQPRYAGYVGWRGMINEWHMPADFHAQMFGHYFFCLPEGEIMLCFPVPGRDNDVSPGRRAYNFGWYHPADEHRTLPDLCTDAAGKCHGTLIPPLLIRPQVVAELRAVAHAVMAPQMARVADLAPQQFFQPIYDLDTPRVANGRVALLGDAAFVARPHTGMGVTKASLDAAWLTDALAADGDVDAALHAEQAKCCLFGSRAVARGRWCGAHLEAQTTTPREQRSAEELQHAPPVVLLREHGAKICDNPELAELV